MKSIKAVHLDLTNWEYKMIEWISLTHDIPIDIESNYTGNQAVISEDSLSKLLYFIDTNNYDVNKIRDKLQQAGKNIFRW